METCPNCNGAGRVKRPMWQPARQCDMCGGTGSISKARTVTLQMSASDYVYLVARARSGGVTQRELIIHALRMLRAIEALPEAKYEDEPKRPGTLRPLTRKAKQVKKK